MPVRILRSHHETSCTGNDMLAVKFDILRHKGRPTLRQLSRARSHPASYERSRRGSAGGAPRARSGKAQAGFGANRATATDRLAGVAEGSGSGAAGAAGRAAKTDPEADAAAQRSPESGTDQHG